MSQPPSKPISLNRRHFLSASAGLALSAQMFAPQIIPSAAAQAAGQNGYKALICIFLFGGMDQADTILPYDQTNFDRLAALRSGLFEAYNVGSGNSSRDRANLIELAPDNGADFGTRKFALPPQMSGMAEMFSDGDMAIVGNVGPLIQPTDRDSFESEAVNLPKRLFSHNDQQSTWMSFGTEGTLFGWGGKFADAVVGEGNPVFTSIGLSGNDVFLSGENIRPFLTTGSEFGRGLNVTDLNWITGHGERYDNLRAELRQFYEQNDRGHQDLLSMDYGNISAQGIANVKEFSTALENAGNFEDRFPDTNMGNQLRTVAETISARGALGVDRQLFYTGMGGFDTHSGQTNSLPNLQQQLSDAVKAFRDVMQAEGLWDDVALFTASDFGRTTIDNGDGTDHGWGAHQFVMGGSIQGRQIYGTLPPPVLDMAQYTEFGGRLIPTVSVDEYAATLGRWFGVPENRLSAILPNLANFGSNVGFV